MVVLGISAIVGLMARRKGRRAWMWGGITAGISVPGTVLSVVALAATYPERTPILFFLSAMFAWIPALVWLAFLGKVEKDGGDVQSPSE